MWAIGAGEDAFFLWCLGRGEEREYKVNFFFLMLRIFVIPIMHRKSWAVLAVKVPVHLYWVGQALRGRNRY